MRPTYSIVTTGNAALAAATAKTVLGIRGNAAFGLDLRKWSVSFDGVTAAAVPVVVDLCYWTFAGGGTSTGATPLQVAGRVQAHGTSGGGQNFTVEPTTLTVLKQILLTPNGGLFVEELDKDAGFDTAFLDGFAIRCTAPAIVNARAFMEFARA